MKVPARSHLLAGAETITVRNLIILEDNPLILLDMQTCIEELGIVSVFAASSLSEARRLINAHPDAVSLLDVDIRGETSFELAQDLVSTGRPMAFMTGYADAGALPEQLRAVPVLRKPVQQVELEKMVRRLITE